MKMKYCTSAILFMLLTSVCHAEVFEVQMLDRGVKGSMVYEPDYLEIQPGDSVRYIPTHKSHNAASIPEMVPEGFENFRSKINETFEVKFSIPGYYGIRCTPHYTMGKVMVIKVGDAEMSPGFKSVKHPPRAQERFQKIFDYIEAKEAEK